jgi:hypothetical protein
MENIKWKRGVVRSPGKPIGRWQFAGVFRFNPLVRRNLLPAHAERMFLSFQFSIFPFPLIKKCIFELS